MKLAEIKNGWEYGVLDSPTSARRGSSSVTPRWVRVVGREKVDVKRYGQWSTRSTIAKETVIEVEFLDEVAPYARTWDSIASAPKGAKLNIKSRQFVGLWTDLHPGVLKRHVEERAREEYRDVVTARLEALLGKKNAPYVSVSTYDGKPIASVHLYDKELNLLLDLAEKGKA